MKTIGWGEGESLGLNLYEMDFIQHDPAIARCTSIDPCDSLFKFYI
jgi:hypothetical protein